MKTLESPLDCKEFQPVHSKGDQPWDFFGRNDAKAETPVLWPPHAKRWLIGKDWTHWKRLWCWEGLGTGGKGDDRGWDGWMASLTRWTWIWVNSRSWWWTGRPGMLWFMGSQRVRHDWATELNWTDTMAHHTPMTNSLRDEFSKVSILRIQIGKTMIEIWWKITIIELAKRIWVCSLSGSKWKALSCTHLPQACRTHRFCWLWSMTTISWYAYIHENISHNVQF